MQNPILTIVKADYVGDYCIKAMFSNGIEKVIDFSPIIFQDKGIVWKLRDIDYFKSFTLDPFTIDWNNEIGFAPEFLYQQGS